jgi:hypothetical protein
MKPPLFIQGMGGMGDCIHQRAIVRQLMDRHAVTLMTPWPSMYHDLIAEGLIVVRRGIALRTQMKNEQRESEAVQFASRHPLAPRGAGMRIAYGGGQVLQTPSKTILEVMCNVTGTSYPDADYRLPVPDAWRSLLFKILYPLPIQSQKKPWMFFRPLVARPEWRGSMARNADVASYRELFNRIRDDFFVISVADLEEGREWLVDPETKADLSFHKGELVFEALAALAQLSELVFTSSGFAAILGPAVGTPTISIVGGYEDPRCHDSGAKFAPYLSIGPRVPCSCWTSACRNVCDKKVEMLSAMTAIDDFLSEIRIQDQDRPRS